MEIGVCCFDDTKFAGSGWTSINGCTPTKISSFAELSSTTLWVCNLDYRTYRKLNLSNTQHIVDSQYFRTSLSILAKELGLTHDNKNLVQRASKIFSRVSKLCIDYLGIAPSNTYKLSNSISDSVIPAALKKHPQGPFKEELLAAFKQSTQQNQAMIGQVRPQGATAYTFSFPRTAYAQWLMGLDYPIKNEWSEIIHKSGPPVFGVEDGVEIKGTKANRKKLLDVSSSKAAFFRVKVHSMSKSYHAICNFGSGASYPRYWASAPEILELSTYAKVETQGGFYSDLGKLSFENNLKEQLDEYSISRSLFYENLWVGLAVPLLNGEIYTPLSAYIRTYDRIACGRAARAFTDHSYIVGSYGTGRVTVYLRPSQLHQASRFALSLGLLPQVEIIGESE